MEMSAVTDDVPTARLKTRYLEEIRPALIGRFGYSSVMPVSYTHLTLPTIYSV